MEAQFGTLTLTASKELEKVQNRAARFVTGNYVFETGSMTGILGNLLRKGRRIVDLYRYTKV